jgi:hypothetical protein
MKIWVFSVCYNEEAILPFWLRHYGSFAERILVWDDKSTDSSRSILKTHPKVSLQDWPWNTGIDEDRFLKFAVETYKQARGQADWVMWVDCDELIYHPDMPALLTASVYEVLPTTGFNMVGDGLPQDDGRQLWEQMPLGVAAPVYSKPVVFMPRVDISWNRGKHAMVSCNGRVAPDAPLKLLHYRYLGHNFTTTRNAKNYQRCGLATGDKSAAWSCAPGWQGEHSPQWSEKAKEKAFNVINLDIPISKVPVRDRLLSLLHQGRNPYKDFPTDQWLGKLKGWGSDHPWFRESIERLKPNVIIEVGTFLGASAIHMAEFLRQLQSDAVILCIDTWLGGFDHWKSERDLLGSQFGRPSIYYHFIANIISKKLEKWVLPLPLDSRNGARLLKSLQITSELIYIDGSHEQGDVYQDLMLYYDDVLLSKGTIIIDDMTGHFPGVLEDVQKFAKERSIHVELFKEKARITKP